MVHFSSSHEDIRNCFLQHDIPIGLPGFYDHPNFIEIENSNDFFLANYARFVSTLSFDENYIAKARNKIPIIVNELYAQMANDNHIGRCIDISAVLSRILEKEELWNFVFKGSLSIEFPEQSNISNKYFWSVDRGDFAARHAWVYAPPYNVIDLSVRQQPYFENEIDFLPNYVIAEDMVITEATTHEIISPEVIDHLISCGIPLANQLEHVNNETPAFIELFPSKSISIHGVSFKYIPIAGLANDCPLEGIANINFQEKTPLQVYNEDIRPQIAHFDI